MTKNIWVTGKKGQLASEIYNLNLNSLGNFHFTSFKDVDISNKNMVEDYIESKKINLIINCAAFTDVDGAEINEKEVYDVNADYASNTLTAPVTGKYIFLNA